MNIEMHNLPTSCTEQQQQIIDAIKNKTIDANLVIKLPSVSVYVGKGWYEVSVVGVYILLYWDESDPNYNYLIRIIKTPGVTIDCEGIVIEKKNKSGTPASDPTIPQSVVADAISSFPTGTTCGTGIWDGCTAGIQNKYLIIGGGIAGLYFMSKRK